MENGVITVPKLVRFKNEVKMTTIFLSSIKGGEETIIEMPNGTKVKGVKIYTSPTDYFKSPIEPKMFAQMCALAIKSGEPVEIAPSAQYALANNGSKAKALKSKY